MKEFKVFVANIIKNDNGELVGKWLDLPCYDFEAELAAIGITEGKEYTITDYENDWNYDVLTSDLDELNELAEKLEKVEKQGNACWLLAYMEAEGCSLEDALEKYDNTSFFPDMSLEDLAHEIVENNYNLPDNVMQYFDFEAYASDLSNEGYTETEYGVIGY